MLDEKCSGVFVGNGFIRSERSVTIHVSLNGICSSVFVGNGFVRSERLVTIHVSLNGKCFSVFVGRVACPTVVSNVFPFNIPW